MSNNTETKECLEKDTDISFPQTIILKASAGSGKTHALTKRFAQFILSNNIDKNHLRNITAITFSNNAAKEMKERVLFWLKTACLQESNSVKELFDVVSVKNMEKHACDTIDHMLDNYTDFQVKTIDSFMTSLFKASALELGISPDFEILLNSDGLFDYSFFVFLRNVRAGSKGGKVFDSLLTIIEGNRSGESPYLWNPSEVILSTIKNIFKKTIITGQDLSVENNLYELTKIQSAIKNQTMALDKFIESSGLIRSKKSSFNSFFTVIKFGSYTDLLGKGLKSPPVTKPKKMDPKIKELYEEILEQWHSLTITVAQYADIYAKTYYFPFALFYSNFKQTLESIKFSQGKVFIEDINNALFNYLKKDVVPEIFFHLGDTIYHYLIDEFQDTSLIQWNILHPLIENSLAQGGSLFAVGDMKQAIYGFRGADYTIMKSFIDNSPFEQANHSVRELATNYRSLKSILEFNESVFKSEVNKHPEYAKAAQNSGLTEYIQHPRINAGDGCTELTFYDKDGKSYPEKDELIKTIKSLVKRGYDYKDIAVLTFRNNDVVNVANWAGEAQIPFISHSSLDIRDFKVTGEVVALLSFLDIPMDGFSFASFCMGQIFSKNLEREGFTNELSKLNSFFIKHRKSTPLYKYFQETFQHLWERFFEDLFKRAGYLPLYELVSEIYRVFAIFETSSEEATLVKFLEVIKDYDDDGYNNIRDFLEFAKNTDSYENQWTVDVPKTMNAIQIMTVHKAKGLGFPVIIALLYGEQNKGFDFVIDKNGYGVNLIKLTKKIVDTASINENNHLRELYDAEETMSKVNSLNSLYVAFTRAKEELYIFAVKGEKDNNKFPFNILPKDSFQPTDDKPHFTVQKKSKEKDTQKTITPYHHYEDFLMPYVYGTMSRIDEIKRGDFIHAVLAQIDFIDYSSKDALSILIDRYIEKVSNGILYNFDHIRQTIIEFLLNKGVKLWFEKIPDRVIFVEKEYVCHRGNFYRMDRVVFDNQEQITVVEYKTGSQEKEQEYVKQVSNYKKILKAIYTGYNVCGLIAYVDLIKLTEV